MSVAEYKGSAGANAPTEEQECSWLFQWAQMTPWMDTKVAAVLFHVPNGAYHGRDREAGAVVAMKLRAQGMQAGVFDYIVPVPKMIYRQVTPGLWLEMKRTKGGTVSKDQKIFMERMCDLGWRCEIAKGWIQAANLIADHLELANR